MKILSIGTSGKICAVALADDKKIINKINLDSGITHSQTLMPTIDKLLTENNLKLSDLDAYATTIGPGSFTGIRIGISTIKGFALAVEKPCIAVPTLLSLCYNVKNFEGIVVSVLDARNDNIYAAIYDNKNTSIPNQIGEYISDTFDALVNAVKKIPTTEKIMFVGDGAITFKEKLSNELKGYQINFAEASLCFEDAESISNAAFDLAVQNKFTEAKILNPMYLKKSQAERELEEKEKKAENL